MYRDVRFLVQRADVARFFILFKFGGLYADLDVFPNLEKFPLVPLGLCKMLASETKTTYVCVSNTSWRSSWYVVATEAT